MAFPSTPEELKKQGYTYEADSICKACGAQMEWWITPKGKHIPLDEDTKQPHWATCPNASDFRNKTR